MEGTIRTFDEEQRDEIHEHVKRISEMIARARARAARVCTPRTIDVTVNDPALTEAMRRRSRASPARTRRRSWTRSAARRTSRSSRRWCRASSSSSASPPEGKDPEDAAPNHSPRFFVDEKCLVVGVRALANVACDFLEAKRAAR